MYVMIRSSFLVALLALLCTCFLAVVFERALSQHSSVQVVDSVYGRIMYDYQRAKDGSIVGSARLGMPAMFSHGVLLHVFHSVHFLDLDNNLVTDDTLRQLGGLRQLKVLHISNCSVTEDGLASLVELSALEVLTLDHVPITDDGLKVFVDFPGLSRLELCDTNVSDAGLRHLEQFSGLRYLNLLGTKVTGLGVLDLQKALPECEIVF